MTKLFMQSRLLVGMLMLFVCGSGLSQVTDVLTANDFPATGYSQYVEFTNVQIKSSAIYAGETANDNGTIQLTTAGDPAKRGIVSTVSGGNITKVKLVWGDTAKDKALNIYGQKIPYTTSKDLYEKKTDGDLLGDITCGKTTELVLDGTYQYIGLRAKDGVIYIKSIEITYDDDTTEDIKQTQTLSFSPSECTFNMKGGVEFVSPTLSGAQTDVTYSSSDTNIASVDAGSGKITFNSAGTVIITATAIETDEYQSATASYTITVTDTEVFADDTYALVAKFGDKYYAMSSNYATSAENSLAAKDVSVVNNEVIMYDSDLSDLRWKNVQIGSNYTFTPASDEDKYLAGVSGSTNLSFANKLCNWKEYNNSWVLKDDESRSFVYYNGDVCFKNYKVSNVGQPNYATSYTLSMSIVPGYTRSVTVGNVGTICLQYAVNASDYVGAEFYSILGKKLDADGNPLSIVCVKEEGDLQAGVPYLFVGNANTIALKYAGEPVTDLSESKGLHGSLTQIEVAEGMYIVSQNQIVKCGAGCSIPANRAYIDMTKVSEFDESNGANEAKSIIEIGGTTVAIGAVVADADTRVDVYNVTGLRVRNQVLKSEATVGLPKGIYIVGNRKVVVK